MRALANLIDYHFGRRTASRGRRPFPDDSSGHVGQRDPQVASANVHADNVTIIGVDSRKSKMATRFGFVSD